MVERLIERLSVASLTGPPFRNRQIKNVEEERNAIEIALKQNGLETEGLERILAFASRSGPDTNLLQISASPAARP